MGCSGLHFASGVLQESQVWTREFIKKRKKILPLWQKIVTIE
jgi:hypothetical protein